jgi:hypothetical protein
MRRPNRAWLWPLHKEWIEFLPILKKTIREQMKEGTT